MWQCYSANYHDHSHVHITPYTDLSPLTPIDQLKIETRTEGHEDNLDDLLGFLIR